MKHATVKESLEATARTDRPMPDEWIQVPVHELVSLTLWSIANPASISTRGAVTKASKAQKMILDRIVGTRRPGTNPAARAEEAIEFIDLTEGAIKE